MKKLKALVIVPQPLYISRGTAFSVYYRTLITAELGTEIDMLYYGKGQDIDIPGVRMIRTPNFKWIETVKSSPFLFKLLSDIFITIWTLVLLLRNRYDFVQAHEEAIFICALLKPIFKYRLIYDMHTSLPEQLTHFNCTPSKRIINLLKWIEEACLHISDATLTLCPSLYNYAVDIVGQKEKVFLIENSIFDEVQLATVQ